MFGREQVSESSCCGDDPTCAEGGGKVSVALGCRVLRGHRGSVLTLFSLGGLLLSGGRDNIIRVWVSHQLLTMLLLHLFLPYELKRAAVDNPGDRRFGLFQCRGTLGPCMAMERPVGSASLIPGNACSSVT